jgi:YVTN family beta-propeller protein
MRRHDAGGPPTVARFPGDAVAWAVLFTLIALASPVFAELPRPVTSQGAAFVHLQPFDQAAARLSFEITSLAALPLEGAAIPIPLSLTRVEGAEMGRQRRLGSGPLPPGRYSGLSVTVQGGRLQREEEPADLVSPSGPVKIPLPFQIEKGGARLLLLTLDYRRSLGEGFELTPAFEARLAVSPPVARLGLASSPEAGYIAVFDKVSAEVVGYVLTLREPSGMVRDRGLDRVYVALAGDDRVIVVGLQNLRVLESLRLQGGDRPVELALTPDGGTLLAVNEGSRTLSFIDPHSMVETDRVVVGNGPRSVLVDARGQRAWVFNTESASLSVIDLIRRTVIGSVATESEPFRGQFAPRGDALYVIHRRSPYLTVIDPATLSVRNRVLLGAPGTALRVNPRNDLVYVAPAGSGQIDVYDPTSFLPVEALPSRGDVSFLAIDGDQNRLFVGFSDRPELLAFPLAGKKIAARTDIGASSYWISLAGER